MITIKELASELRLSIATVSLALHDSPRISAATTSRVKAAAQRHSYRVSNIGKALQSGHIRIIGCVLGSLLNSFFSEIVEAIGHTCASHDYGLMLALAASPTKSCVEQMLDNRVSGVIFAGHTSMREKDAEVLSKAKIPVLFCSTNRHGNFPHVVTDDRLGGEIGINHLLKLGHRNFLLEHTTPVQRYESAIEVLAKHHNSNFQFFEQIDDLPTLIKLTGATAVVAYSDLTAINAIGLLKNQGYQIPEDVSIIGYDNLPICAHPQFNLTTVAQQRAELGMKAAKILLEHIEKKKQLPSKGILLPPTLMIRNSCRKI
jgi:LacI family transcriptional regulator